MPLKLHGYLFFQHLALFSQHFVLLPRLTYAWNHAKYTWSLHVNKKNVHIEDFRVISLCVYSNHPAARCQDDQCYVMTEFRLLRPKTIDVSNFHVKVAKCIQTKNCSWKLNKICSFFSLIACGQLDLHWAISEI